MSRMDVKKKLELSYVMESYWDMLPNEIKEYIVHLKIEQQKIDEDKKEKMQSLCEEIKLYGELKAKWRLGHIKCRLDHECKKYEMYDHVKYGLVKCNKDSHLEIVGQYVNESNVKCEMYLGHGFQQALSRVNHVKSFL